MHVIGAAQLTEHLAKLDVAVVNLGRHYNKHSAPDDAYAIMHAWGLERPRVGRRPRKANRISRRVRRKKRRAPMGLKERQSCTAVDALRKRLAFGLALSRVGRLQLLGTRPLSHELFTRRLRLVTRSLRLVARREQLLLDARFVLV